MLAKLLQASQEGGLTITHAYLGHIKKDEERKILAHADAMAWADVEPSVRAVFEGYLNQAVAGPPGEVNFPCAYTGEVLAVDKVVSVDYDRTRNRPAVEVLEAVRDMHQVDLAALVDLGNALAYKVMAAGAVKNHMLGMLRLQLIPTAGARPVPFVFATLCDLDDRAESLFDEMKGRFVTQELHNVVRRGSVSRAVFFPCLDEDGREMADLLVYATSGAGAWFKALEATRRLSPRREGQALVRMITEQSSGGEVPHSLFHQMGEHLLVEAVDGIRAESVADSVEKAVGYGIDRKGFLSSWETTFGSREYRPAYGALFEPEREKPTKLKMQAGDILISLTPADLQHFRQVTAGGQTFIVFAVPEQAKVVVGKDLDLKIRPVALNDLRAWLGGQSE